MSETERTFEEIAEEYDVKYKAANPDLPEAGGVSYCTMYSKTGIALNVTGRGVNPLRAIESLIGAITIAEKRWSLRPDKSLANPASPAAPPVKNPSVADLTDGELVYEDIELAPPDGKKWITFDADIVKVLPQPEDKVTLEFYADGKKFAGVKVNKWKIENADGLMKHVTSESMAKAAEYKLPCRVYYTEGKEGKTAEGKTFHYKDVSHVRPR